MMNKPKVLLLGDSIRMGYQEIVKENLKEFDVFYPQENGRDVTMTLWQGNQMFKEYGDFDVIHWNNGYWDMNVEAPMKEAFHPLSEYEHYLHRLAQFFKEHCQQLIFMTTFPVNEKGNSLDWTGTEALITYDNQWVHRYNEMAKKVMSKEKVIVNDLNPYLLQQRDYFKGKDGLHLSQQGNAEVGLKIADIIRENYHKIECL